MLLTDYQLDELHFAYCFHLYLRWQTQCRRPCAPLAQLDGSTLRSLTDRFAIHILTCESDPTEVRVLASLQPQETPAACASKLKGQTSKWLRETLGLRQPQDLLSKGYFACTSGKSTAEQVETYLDGQAEHHGYTQRVLPPVHLENFDVSPREQASLQPKHACTVLQFHLVLATWRRRGVFGPVEAAAIARSWRELQGAERFVLRKVSFLPDHVHVAVRTHPTVAPGGLAVELMNAAQRTLWEGFVDSVVQAGVERLWQPSAYIGSFGDLATAQMQCYLANSAARKEE